MTAPGRRPRRLPAASDGSCRDLTQPVGIGRRYQPIASGERAERGRRGRLCTHSCGRGSPRGVLRGIARIACTTTAGTTPGHSIGANPQVSSETLRLAPLTWRSVMSSQRQGATRTVEESLRKWNGASREADRGFHSLSCAFLRAAAAAARFHPAPMEPTARRRCAFGRLARRHATNGRSHSGTQRVTRVDNFGKLTRRRPSRYLAGCRSSHR